MVENYKITEENASGCCPECNHSWDKGDVMDYVKESYPKFEEEDLLKIAKRDFGWTPENPRRFNHLLFIEASDGDIDFDGSSGYYQCPNCQIAWGSYDGQRTDKYKVILDNHDEMKELLKRVLKNNQNK
jgi:hypothetical protein